MQAIAQQTARKNEWPLDKVVLTVDVTKKFNREDFGSAPREGAYLYGLFMAGARWDTQTGLIQEARLKELVPQMPIIFCKVSQSHIITSLLFLSSFLSSLAPKNL